MSLWILLTLVLGILAGTFFSQDFTAFLDSSSSYMLWGLIFFVGIDIGANQSALRRVTHMGWKILLFPAAVILGSLLGGGILSLLLPGQGLKEGLAISSGLGWYSLSGILITEAGSPVAGSIAFLSNVIREVITFISVPLIAKYLGHYCAIAPAGATAMDTTLALISRNTDSETAILAFVSGICCTLAVPILVPLFL